MDPVVNPYAPGAGSRPPALVGRDEQIDNMSVALRRLLLGSNARSQILTGLRGVGKTVMLVEFQELAEAHGYFHAHIEVTEDGNLAPDLAAALRRVLLAMDAKRRAGETLRRAFGVLKAFSLRIPDGTELSIDVDAISGPADSGNLGADLAGLFVELGTAARDHGTGILLTVDELHYVDRATLESLIIGLHRSSQLALPVAVAGAGLPTLAATTAGAYSDTLDGIEYTVTVSAGGTGTTTPYTWTSTDTTDHAGGSGSATNGTAKAVGTMGVTITFASGTAYPSGAIYMVKVGAFPASALALNTVNFAVTPQTGTTSGVPLSINNGTTVPGGGSAVKFVTAAANTGMGAYQVTPGVQVTPDASTWAGVAYASTLTYTIVSGP